MCTKAFTEECNKYKGGNECSLTKAPKPLFGPGGVPLFVFAVVSETLCNGEKTAKEDIYVIGNLHTSLLGREAIAKLN